MQPTPLSAVTLMGREFLIKRDDLFDPFLSGNKFRKLHSLIYTPKHSLYKVVSYGGTQSNAMLALAKLCHDKGWEFVYYTRPLSKRLRENVHGNLAQACSLGMRHVEIAHEIYREFIASLQQQEGVALVHQGGAMPDAKEGIEVLAKELRLQCPQTMAVATPSGTGTSAFYLAHALPERTVYTTPCVGDEKYLYEQMRALGELPENLVVLSDGRKYPFAKPNKEFYELYSLLKKSGVEFDLIYAPLMWKMLLEFTNEDLLYVHSGGVSGNASMLERYRRDFPSLF